MSQNSGYRWRGTISRDFLVIIHVSWLPDADDYEPPAAAPQKQTDKWEGEDEEDEIKVCTILGDSLHHYNVIVYIISSHCLRARFEGPWVNWISVSGCCKGRTYFPLAYSFWLIVTRKFGLRKFIHVQPATREYPRTYIIDYTRNSNRKVVLIKPGNSLILLWCTICHLAYCLFSFYKFRCWPFYLKGFGSPLA